MVHEIYHEQEALRFLPTLLRQRQSHASVIDGEVQAVIEDVIARGDQALVEYTRRFDGHERPILRFEAAEIRKHAANCPAKVREALQYSAARIAEFHRHCLPQDSAYHDDTGVLLGYRYTPISAAGVYVPGGSAAYPSSVLMNVIPAQIAGVERLVVCTPTPQAEVNSAVMAALDILAVQEVYAVGGAQAIAAMAYGTETIAALDFIAGPGNAYVTAAKKQVFGRVGIDSLAGPSEVTVVADSSANPVWLAADLLAQAEHDPAAQSILITHDSNIAQATKAEVSRQLQALPRGDIARASWAEFGVIIVVQQQESIVSLVDLIAPEHLIIATENPAQIFAQVRHAGSVFLGHYTPEAVGDYTTGPNHVLPTSGRARYASGLSTTSFMKRTTFQQFDAETLAKVAPAAVTLAEAEGLKGHAQSLRLRLDRKCVMP